jgi:DNA-binding NtrC family response regulator
MKTILVVDDEEGIRISLGEILGRFGYRVMTESNCDAALALFREGTPVDLVITDYLMPGMDGLEFITRLKHMAPSVPVVVMTGSQSIESYLKAVSLGVFEYLSKPLRSRDLVRVVRTALGEADPGKPGPV